MRAFYLLFAVFLCLSCSSDTDEFGDQNDQEILAYIERHNLNAQKTSSGLYYVITRQGAGVKPTSTSNVTVNYKGYFIDDRLFEENKNASFNLQNVIAGWREGLTYFNEDTEGFLLIPSKLGYGSAGKNGIPGGAALVFSIHLLKVN